MNWRKIFPILRVLAGQGAPTVTGITCEALLPSDPKLTFTYSDGTTDDVDCLPNPTPPSDD